MKFLLAFQLLLISFIASAQNNKQILPTTIHGNVASFTTKKPLDKVTVILFKNGSEVKRVSTDSRGNYNFGNLDAGTYDLRFEANGYVTEKREKLPLRANKKLRIAKLLKSETNS
jgi:hypothetical protein